MLHNFGKIRCFIRTPLETGLVFKLQLNYFSLAENESKARVKFNLLEKMIQPCGPPSEKKQED